MYLVTSTLSNNLSFPQIISLLHEEEFHYPSSKVYVFLPQFEFYILWRHLWFHRFPLHRSLFFCLFVLPYFYVLGWAWYFGSHGWYINLRIFPFYESTGTFWYVYRFCWVMSGQNIEFGSDFFLSMFTFIVDKLWFCFCLKAWQPVPSSPFSEGRGSVFLRCFVSLDSTTTHGKHITLNKC